MRQNTVSTRTFTWQSWAAPSVAFLAWSATTASLVAWGLAFWPQDPQPLISNLAMGAATSSTASPTELGKVLGAGNFVASEPAAPSLVSRLALIGIAKSGADMTALIAIDGQAAKPFAKGTEVLPGLVLQSVSLQQANLGASTSSPVQLSLDMPKRNEPARGVIAP